MDFIKVVPRLTKIFLKEKYDIVQYATANASLCASLAAKFAGIKHRLYCQWGIPYLGFKGIKRGVFKFIERMICFNSTIIEPDSEGNRGVGIRDKLYKEDKVRVIGNGSACGIDLKKFDFKMKDEYRNLTRKSLGIESKDFVFGYVGRMRIEKGTNELLSAFKSVHEEFENTILLLIGAIENENSLDHVLLDWAKNCKAVIFYGKSTTVERQLAAMDCFVFPSYREGFGLSVLEAEAMGIPSIVTNIPGPKDAVKPGATALIVPVKDSMSLHDAMLQIMFDPNMQNSMCSEAISLASNNFERDSFMKELVRDRKAILEMR